jgi:hypothetical protein
MTVENPNRRRNIIIGIAAGAFLLCCCVSTMLGLWFSGDSIMQWYNSL